MGLVSPRIRAAGITQVLMSSSLFARTFFIGDFKAMINSFQNWDTVDKWCQPYEPLPF